MGRQVVLQPAGGGTATIHYNETVASPVPLSRLKPYLSGSDSGRLEHLYPKGVAPIWGVTPGKDDRNRNRWERMNVGDVVLFAGKGRIFSTGKVALKIHNKELALDLWKTHEDEETWEYVYFLTNIKDVDIQYGQFNAAAGYKHDNVIQGFEVLPDEKANSILHNLRLDAMDYDPSQQLISELSNIADTEGAFDVHDEEDGRKRALASIVRRQGQPQFRQRLLELYESKCAISGCDAVQALEAAHIVPYNGEKTNYASNGILLRSDLHTLFDLGLLTVDATSMTVKLASSLKATAYAVLDGQPIQLPHDTRLCPSKDALAKHNAFSSGQMKTRTAS